LDAKKNTRAPEFSAEEEFDATTQNSFEVIKKMRDERFSTFNLNLLLHFLLDKILECHYTL